ncbi:MAG TPA: response regulator [Polyangiaceae bacterium]|nr:response regulator [Polyangiaceae bacterium]
MATLARQHKRQIVVIEDEPDLVDLLKDLLQDEGHQVWTAADGPTGLALIRATHPDVVLCDLGLPGFDGHAVARAVREDPSLAATRLLALSGWTQPQDVAKARASGFDVVLPKPLGVDSVITEVERA